MKILLFLVIGALVLAGCASGSAQSTQVQTLEGYGFKMMPIRNDVVTGWHWYPTQVLCEVNRAAKEAQLAARKPIPTLRAENTCPAASLTINAGNQWGYSSSTASSTVGSAEASICQQMITTDIRAGNMGPFSRCLPVEIRWRDH